MMRRHRVSSMTTESTEEYLEVLSRIRESGDKFSNKNIAERLGISQASVSEMLRRLEKDGFIEHEPYGKIILTRKGTNLGGKVLKKHRLIEGFLNGVGMRKSRIHDEACRLEHHISDELAGLMVQRTEQKKPRNGILSISEMNAGEEGIVISISSCPKSARRLEDMGLTPDARIKVKRTAPFSGPVEISIRGSSLVLGNGMASKVLVKVGK
ncbi:MAG: metal-dependent transcriptional regulator [Candidatus Aenigmarchaeota archaeon]|nr:metal-dependent transcriptional regulator [Candidatus Aenigmarchaeota archaeon]